MENDASDNRRWLDAQIKAARKLNAAANQALRQGRTSAGAEALEEAQVILEMAEMDTDELLETRARVFNEFGVVHQRQGRLEESKEYHRRAADLCDELMEKGADVAGNSAATHLNLSSIQLALEEDEEALRSGERALELLDLEADDDDAEDRGPDPLELGARQNLAVLYARSQNWDKANEMMDQASQLAEDLAAAGRPNYLAQLAQGCQQLSVILFKNDRYDDALRWGRRAEELSERGYETLGQQVLPVYVVSQINLLSYYEQLGQFADAEDCLWKALDVAGNDARILYRGVTFYETCRKQADARLEKGNLPRQEVDDGYGELMDRVEAAGGLETIKNQARQRRR